MDITITDFKKICRTCLQEPEDLLPIYDTISTSNVELTNMLESCSFLKPRKNDGLPDQICNNCLQILIQSYNFKLQCQQTEKTLNTILQKHNLEIQVEEVIIKNDNDEIKVLKEEYEYDDSYDNDPIEVDNNELLIENIVVTNDENLNTDVAISNLNPSVLYGCETCEKYFLTQTELMDHNILQHGVNSYPICYKCEKTFDNEEIFNVHVQNCRIYECAVCNKKFRFAVYLRNHMRKHNVSINSTDENTKFNCSQCDKSYTSITNLEIHQFSHSGVKPYKCSVCKKGFTKMNALKTHIAIHTGEKEYLCTDCGKSFTSSAILKQHRKIHSGIKPHKCPHCPRSFIASGDLTVHMRVHTGEKPYLCPTCGRGFSRITHLNTHIRTHTGEKPFKCDECGRCFAQSGDLRAHERTHTGERPYQCSICLKRFSQNSGLASHMATHNGLKKHECTKCHKRFSQSSSLTRHLKTHIL